MKQKKIEELTERGKKFIYKGRYELWKECVESSVEDIYGGAELENALQIIEALDAGESVEFAQKIFDNEGHSGMSASLALKQVLYFSKRGPEFFRNQSYYDPETHDNMLKKIENDNKEFEKQENSIREEQNMDNFLKYSINAKKRLMDKFKKDDSDSDESNKTI